MNKYIDRFISDVRRGVSLALQGGVVLIGALALIWLVGSLFEGVVRIKEQDDRCRKDAATPYEYHRC